MKRIRQIRMLLSGKPVKQTKPKNSRRPLKAVLLGAVIGWMLDLLEGRWKNDLWKPKG